MFSRSTENRLPRKSRRSRVRSCGCKFVCTGVCETCVIGELFRFTAAIVDGVGSTRRPTRRTSLMVAVKVTVSTLN